MQGRIFQGLYLLPLVAFVTSCASYTSHTGTFARGDSVAYVYVQTSTSAWEADPSVPPSILAFRVGADGTLTQVQTLRTSESLMMGRSGVVFTSDAASRAIHRYAIGQDGSLTGPVSTLDPAMYDPTGCGGPTGHGMLDPTGTCLTVELENQNCDVWQTYRLQPDGTYQFLGQDDSGQWLMFKGGVLMGWPGFSGMSRDGQYAYAMGDVEGDTFLAAMKRDASGVMRIWQGFNWPFDTQYRWQPGGPLTDANDHLVLPMVGQTNATWNQTWLASFNIDPGTGDLQPISPYSTMPKTDASEGVAVAFSPQGEDIAAAGNDGTLQTFLFHNDGPATPSATTQLSAGQFPQQMAWDTSHHLYLVTQTSVEAPAIAQFRFYMFTAADGQLKPAPGSPWNVPNAYSLVVVPKG
jgi:hypothetical protein